MHSSTARRIVYSLALSLVLAVPAFLYYSSTSDSTLESLACLQLFGDNRRLAGQSLSILGFGVIFCISFLLFEKCNSLLTALERIKLPRFLPLTFSPKSIAKTAILVLVCWIPTLIMLFPCATTSVDTINQLYQFFTPSPTYYTATQEVIDASIIDHHPWFDTIVFGAIVNIGYQLGSDTLGMFLYGLLQTLMTAISVSVATCYLERLSVPAVLRLLALAFMVLFPGVAASADTMQKDSLFSVFFLVFFVCYLEIFRSKGETLKRRWFLITLILVACFCALTKKTGVYVVALSLLVAIVVIKANRTKLAVAAFSPILICSMLLPAILFPILDVAPGGNQEMLGILYQQNVTVLKERPDSVSKSDLETMNLMFDVEKASEKFEHSKTDNVKRHRRASATSEDLKQYLVMWAKMGLRNPDIYVKSVLRCTATSLIPSKHYGIPISVSQDGIKKAKRWAKSVGTSFEFNAKSPKATQQVAKTVSGFYRSVICTIPGFSLFCTAGFYATWIPLIALAIMLFYKQRRNAFALTPIFLSALILLASPASLSRYSLCLLYCAILILGWAVYCIGLRRASW